MVLNLLSASPISVVTFHMDFTWIFNEHDMRFINRH